MNIRKNTWTLLLLVAGMNPSCAVNPSLRLSDAGAAAESVGIRSAGLAEPSSVLQTAWQASSSGDLDDEYDYTERDGYRVYRVGSRDTRGDAWEAAELPLLLSLPLGGLYEALRFLIVEDADSIFTPREYDTFVALQSDGDADSAIGLDDPFEIVVRLIAIDNFSEGRLRDSLGGDGGELTLQASLNALDSDGQPVRPGVLDTDAVERDLPLAAFLKGIHDAEERMDDIGRRGAASRDRLAGNRKRLEDSLAANDNRGAREAAIRAEVEHRRDAIRDLPAAEREVAEPLLRQLERQAFRSAGRGDRPNEIADAMDPTRMTDRGLADAAAREKPSLLGESAERFVRTVEVIRGLAEADRLLSMDFVGIRPLCAAGAGTAAVAFCGNEEGTEDRYTVYEPGVLYRGTVRDLSGEREATGFSLSTLMLERDTDQIVSALAFIRDYARENDIEVNVSGLNIEIAQVAEGLRLIAEKVADDDVELQSFDVRFSTGALDPGASPGKRVFRLRPGSVVVTRNFAGEEFGAVAVLEIRPLK